MTNLTELPHLTEVFDRLRGGRHLCADDGAVFIALHADCESYATLFKSIGFDLIKHDHGFYYFGAETDLGKEATQLSVFFFVLVESWSDAGRDIEASAFDPAGHRISELPHLSRESWRQCLAEAGIQSETELADLVKRMDRYGFTARIDEDRFRFRTPAWR